MSTDQWIKTHTFHYSQFSDLTRLVREKEKQNVAISLCIPTLNEDRTIGKEIVLLRSELMQRVPLLDEIAVIDSGSTDATRETARSFGADVYLASEILPEKGIRHGKGENLWKAVYQLRGDIIVYVDADIRNIHPRFVYGLVGPLLINPEMKYIKAFYDRPLTDSQGIRPSGGGRVTEILVRPLFSLFFPELAAIIQPLSGEYAVRREVLESIPFPVGYGVETSHLIDVYRTWGLDAFGQTDLDQRIHRNQTTQQLGRMAFCILQTFCSRTQDFRHTDKQLEMNTILRQFQVNNGQFEQVECKIESDERPPMIELEAYRLKREQALS